MILRFRWRLPIFLLLVYSFHAKCQNLTDGQLQCPQNTFLCVKESSCIPLNWVGDGEADCEDGSDEKQGAKTEKGPEEVLSRATENIDQDDQTDTPPISGDPFSEIEVRPDAHHPAEKQKSAPEDSGICSPEQSMKVDECIGELDAWIADFNKLDFNETSLFKDQVSLDLLEHGCELTMEFKACMDGLPEACQPPEGPIHDWLIMQMYACELLVPSLKEHPSCFAIARDQACPPIVKSTADTGVCNLVKSVSQDLVCVERVHNNRCNEMAVEMFGPMQSETEHLSDDLKCDQAREERPKPQVVSPKINAPKVKSVEKKTQEITTEQLKSQGKYSTKPSSMEKSEEMVDLPELNHDNRETTQNPAIRERITTSQTSQDTSKTILLTENTEPVTESVTSSTDSEQQPPKEVHNELANSLYAFAMVDEVCASNPDDIWKDVRTHLCARKEELRAHQKCFEESASRENNKCIVPPEKRTNCGAIDTFIRNIDCVINTLNDLCPVEAQDIVVDVQDHLNDEAIALKCYQQVDATTPPMNDDGFQLHPTNQMCTSDQENQALGCLVELVEINKQLAQFNANFLLEVSDPNSTAIQGICDLYNKYEKCLTDTVFVQSEGRRCAFNAPLNTLARIGLSPICREENREVLKQGRGCLMEIAKHEESKQCQTGLQNLGGTVNLMLQGIHGEALLCKSFYLLRQAFECGDKLVQSFCDTSLTADLNRLKDEMTDLGYEEGCPVDEPPELDEIIAKPVKPATTPPPKSVKQPSPPIPAAPVVKPIAQEPPSQSLPPPLSPSPVPSNNQACDPEEQKLFGACVQPLTTFQPHPLAVIKQPRQIDEACEAFKKFNECRASIKCNPLWAKGMTAMFEYACGDGYKNFLNIRRCVRNTTTRDDIRECVSTFSKGAPNMACSSSNVLLKCALPPIAEKCGMDAVDFVKEYVKRFATTIDPQCRVGEELESKAIVPIGCSASEQQIVDHCSPPLNDLASRFEELFQGGFQSFIKNVNNMAPIFAQGCNLTSEFRECVKPILQTKTSCIVSSCLIKAGNGICNQPDVAVAIDTNLGCIFKQIQNPDFAKCLRSTITNLKQFNLMALRGVLPKFTDCVEPIVSKQCGPVPINVLKAISSVDACPVGLEAEPIQAIVPVTEKPSCTPTIMQQYDQCTKAFHEKYSFIPMALVNSDDELNATQLCEELETMSSCLQDTMICEADKERVAFRKMLAEVCSVKDVFSETHTCVRKIMLSEEGLQCMSKNKDSHDCMALQEVAECLAKPVSEQCNGNALSLAYSSMNEYLSRAMPNCTLNVPSVSLHTGCSEEHLIAHLECETLVDRFRFKPIAFIINASKWDDFCQVISEQYRPCIEKLECRFEPASSASLNLFEHLCSHSETKENQKRFGSCLSSYAMSPTGQKCIEPFMEIDLLARDAAINFCKGAGRILGCAANQINTECGTEALEHVYKTHNKWVRGFESDCNLEMPSLPTIEPASPPSTTIPTTKATTTPKPTTMPSTSRIITTPSTALPTTKPRSAEKDSKIGLQNINFHRVPLVTVPADNDDPIEDPVTSRTPQKLLEPVTRPPLMIEKIPAPEPAAEPSPQTSSTTTQKPAIQYKTYRGNGATSILSSLLVTFIAILVCLS